MGSTLDVDFSKNKTILKAGKTLLRDLPHTHTHPPPLSQGNPQKKHKADSRISQASSTLRKLPAKQKMTSRRLSPFYTFLEGELSL